MSDHDPDAPTHDAPGPPDPPPAAAAPAVHDSELWDGPRWILNADRTPVYCATKQEYWDLLKRHDLHMKDQQESRVPSSAAVLPRRTPTPDVPREQLTLEDARLLAAMSVVFRTYGLREALFCQRCFQAGRTDGCRQVIRDREVSLECRCGKIAYVPPRGATDVVIRTLGHTPITPVAQTRATILTGMLGHTVPTYLLNSTEAMIVRTYKNFLRARDYEPRWFCLTCWAGRDLSEDASIGIKISDHQIILLCLCRLIFDQQGPSVPIAH